jgi:hypothetical protein
MAESATGGKEKKNNNARPTAAGSFLCKAGERERERERARERATDDRGGQRQREDGDTLVYMSVGTLFRKQQQRRRRRRF